MAQTTSYVGLLLLPLHQSTHTMGKPRKLAIAVPALCHTHNFNIFHSLFD
jgi:hypothetical protein